MNGTTVVIYLLLSGLLFAWKMARKKMAFIDEKGRIGGKINIIDLLVWLFILCLAPSLYFGWKIFTEKSKFQSTIISFDKTEYQKEQKRKDNKILQLENMIYEFLKEHKKARKHFKVLGNIFEEKGN